MLLSGQMSLDLLILHRVECGPLLAFRMTFPYTPRSNPCKTRVPMLLMDNAGSDRLLVCLDLLLFEIQFPFDLVQHFIIDATLIAQLDDCGSLG